jgi:hypothetical protein
MNISQNIFLSLKPAVLIDTKLQIKTLNAIKLEQRLKIKTHFRSPLLEPGFSVYKTGRYSELQMDEIT